MMSRKFSAKIRNSQKKIYELQTAACKSTNNLRKHIHFEILWWSWWYWERLCYLIIFRHSTFLLTAIKACICMQVCLSFYVYMQELYIVFIFFMYIPQRHWGKETFLVETIKIQILELCKYFQIKTSCLNKS